jgi:hypothetical protein
VIISAPIRWEEYNTESYCWLSTEKGTRWAFMAPMLVVIAINSVIFFLVMRTIFQAPRRKAAISDAGEFSAKLAQLKKGAKATLSFFCILGITWIFGALSVGDAAVVFVYLFALFNGFQGVFIFVFHCYMDQKYVKSYL